MFKKACKKLYQKKKGGYVSITSLILVDLLGLERMTDSFGVLTMFQGLATVIGKFLFEFKFIMIKNFFKGNSLS
jgi:hypothetical protein